MFISAFDLEVVRNKIVSEVENGNTWMVYKEGSIIDRQTNLHFFQSGLEARAFCINKHNEQHLFSYRDIEQLVPGLNDRLKRDALRNDIDYYFINGDDKISATLKLNPDHNPLHNPDGNDFTDQLIEHWEARQIHANIDSQLKHIKGQQQESKDRPVPYENINKLRTSLTDSGYKGLSEALDEQIIRSKAKFNEKSFEEFGSDVVAFRHSFNRSEEGFISVDRVRATLYFNKDIEHGVINGVDTKALDKDMKAMDWYIDLAESPEEYIKGFKKIGEIENSLRQLSHHPDGERIAVQLWNNHVPPVAVDKPNFITRIEDKVRIYPEMEFPGNTTAGEIYEKLKQKQQLEIADNRMLNNNVSCQEDELLPKLRCSHDKGIRI